MSVQGPVPGLAEQVKELLPNAVEVTLDYLRTPTQPQPGRTASMPPGELFAEFYQRRNEAAAGGELMDLFQAVYEEAHG